MSCLEPFHLAGLRAKGVSITSGGGWECPSACQQGVHCGCAADALDPVLRPCLFLFPLLGLDLGEWGLPLRESQGISEQGTCRLPSRSPPSPGRRPSLHLRGHMSPHPPAWPPLLRVLFSGLLAEESSGQVLTWFFRFYRGGNQTAVLMEPKWCTDGFLTMHTDLQVSEPASLPPGPSGHTWYSAGRCRVSRASRLQATLQGEV